MFNRQSVRVTYAHKKKRVQNATRTLVSSPLEVLPPEMDDLTRTQMTRRMLKRSRRVALAEQLEDKNVEHIREHLVKRIKRNQRISSVEPAGIPPQADVMFQTPFPSVHSVHELAVANSHTPDPEQLSPVPVTKRIASQSRNLKENSTHSQTLASPFSSRPGSAAPSPKHKGKASSRRGLPRSLHVKSRTLSGVFKEKALQVSRKNSTVSLKDTNPRTKKAKHHRYLSNPSTSYMRSQVAQEDWITPRLPISRTIDGFDVISSPEGSVHSDASFYEGRPQFCSTPVTSRLRAAPDLGGRETTDDSLFSSGSLRKDSLSARDLDIEMMDGTAPPRRQTVHLSRNSIFPSSGEFSVGTLPGMNKDATTTDGNDVSKVSAHRNTVSRSHASHALAGSFVAEYDVPLSDLDYSPVWTAATKIVGSGGVPKQLIGERSLALPGTSPAHGGNLLIRPCRRPRTPSPPVAATKVLERVPKPSVGERSLVLPRTSPAHGGTLVIRPCRKANTPISPTSPGTSRVPYPPSSPASDLAQELGSMDVRGDLDTHSDGETHRASAPVSFPPRTHSLQGALPVTEPTEKKTAKRKAARNRASTIRATDFVKPGPSASSSDVAPSSSGSSLANVRRTRSGTVVGPDSKLATKRAGAKGVPTTRPEPESESDDELLLKAAWVEDIEYLGVAVPLDEDASADELNLGFWSGPPRRGSRRR